jgi:hypothetical protein
MFITNNKTFDETALADQQLYHGHGYVMHTADYNTDGEDILPEGSCLVHHLPEGVHGVLSTVRK